MQEKQLGEILEVGKGVRVSLFPPLPNSNPCVWEFQFTSGKELLLLSKQLPGISCCLWEFFSSMEWSQTNNVPIMEELLFSGFEMRIIKCLTLIM